MRRISVASMPVATLVALVAATPVARAQAKGPSFDCAKAEGEVQQLVCKDEGLAALDRKLDEVYKAARAKATKEKPPVLVAEQRGWVKGRDDCWKAEDLRDCVAREYGARIDELKDR